MPPFQHFSDEASLDWLSRHHTLDTPYGEDKNAVIAELKPATRIGNLSGVASFENVLASQKAPVCFGFVFWPSFVFSKIGRFVFRFVFSTGAILKDFSGGWRSRSLWSVCATRIHPKTHGTETAPWLLLTLGNPACRACREASVVSQLPHPSASHRKWIEARWCVQ